MFACYLVFEISNRVSCFLYSLLFGLEPMDSLIETCYLAPFRRLW